MALPELPAHNWLITGLECYDCCGWDGCEKWAQRELFLTEETLRRDICLRDMQMIWGVFSAIPAEYTREDIYQYPLPESETSRYMGSTILPQHPLAFLELYVDDGCDTYVSAHDPALLAPLYGLSAWDAEADNRRMNAQLRHIQDILRREVPDVPPEIANEVQWQVWWALFRNRPGEVKESLLHAMVMAEYLAQRLPGKKHQTPYWDPYAQK